MITAHTIEYNHINRKPGELPFDFERRRLSVIVQHDEEIQLITKGAPENIMQACASYNGLEQYNQLSFPGSAGKGSSYETSGPLEKK